MPKKEIKGTKLTCAAALYKGMIYVIPAPAEHNDVINYIQHTLNETVDGSQTLGFLTDKDEFLTTEESIEFARKLGMLR